MRGFTDSTMPVFIKVVAEGLPTTEVQVDGTMAEATDYGILVTTGGVRYFVPWGRVVYVKQAQNVSTPGVPPVQAPVPPTPPVQSPPPPPPVRPPHS